jgi:hypothetical protein
MKHLIVTATIGLSLACIANATTATERYVVDRYDGFAVMGIIAHTPAEFVLAQREAQRWEAHRHLGLGPQSITAVAVDASDEIATTRGQPAKLIQAVSSGTSVAGVLSH